MKNRKQTSSRIAGLAARTLGDPRSSTTNKALAASALSQVRADGRGPKSK